MQIYKYDITNQMKINLDSLDLLKHKLLFFDIETDGQIGSVEAFTNAVEIQPDDVEKVKDAYMALF